MPTGPEQPVNPDAQRAVKPSSKDAGLPELCRDIESTVSSLIDEVIRVGADRRKQVTPYSGPLRRKLDVLKELLASTDAAIVPVFDPAAPLGHRIPNVGKWLPPPAGKDFEMLDDLASRRLLERQLFNRVHLCPDCRCCQLNFRESCPVCGSIDVSVEKLIHHFPCAYIGLESEFTNGSDLRCPKCRKRLRQLGRDFDRPNDTLVCQGTGHLFDEPMIEGQCLHCGKSWAGDELEVVSVHSYRPTPLALRAVELNRLTGLDVSEIMYDSSVELNTRDFLDLQAKREHLRMRRYGDGFATVVIDFSNSGERYPIFREWTGESLRALAQLLTKTLRDVDLVARLDEARIGILLIEVDVEKADAVERRVRKELQQFRLETATGRELELHWAHHVWVDPDVELSEVLASFDSELADEATTPVEVPIDGAIEVERRAASEEPRE